MKVKLLKRIRKDYQIVTTDDSVLENPACILYYKYKEVSLSWSWSYRHCIEKMLKRVRLEYKWYFILTNPSRWRRRSVVERRRRRDIDERKLFYKEKKNESIVIKKGS